MNSEQSAPFWQRLIGYVLPLVLIVVPALVLYGWHADIVAFRNVLPQFTPMNPTTAVCFLLTGLALAFERLCRAGWLQRIPLKVAGLASLGVGASMLLYYTAGTDLGVDRLLFSSKLGINRMAMMTSVNFLLIGTCLVAKPRLRGLMRVAYGIAGAISLYALAAYLYNFVGVYGQTIFNPMAIHTALLFLITATYLFIQDYRSKEFPIRVGSSVFAAIGIMFVGLLISSYIYTQIQNQMAYTLFQGTDSVKAKISLSDIAALRGDESDLGTPAYENIKSTLSAIPGATPEFRFVYLLGRNQLDEVYFFADSEDPSSPDYSPPGQIYYEASEGLHELWTQPHMIVEGPESDRWGSWISGLAPIKDANGKVVAVLGIDIAADAYMRELIIYTWLPVICAGVLSGILIFSRRSRKSFAAMDQEPSAAPVGDIQQ